jgi:hypothetical protein
MPYDRTRHQELLAKLDAGLAKVSGPQCYNADTATSDGAFDDLLYRIVDTIDFRLSYGRNSAEFEAPLVPSSIIMAGRVIAALEDQGFSATVYVTHRDSVSYLTFEAVLLPLKEEAAVEPEPTPVESKPASVEGATNDITPGTVVSVFSQGMFAEKTQRVVAALETAGYNVRHIATPAASAYPAFEMRCVDGAPEAERVTHILRGLTNETVQTARLSKAFSSSDEYNVYLSND